MFRGSFELRTDEKGRFIVPQKFRAQLGPQFIITKGVQSCLFVMTEEEWRGSFEEKFSKLRFLDPHRIRVERYFTDGLIEAAPDGQGRVALNQVLRSYAGIGLQSDIVMFGMTNRIEIWSKDRWGSASSEITEDDLMSSAAEIGIGAF